MPEVMHYLPPRDDGKPTGSSPAFTTDPDAVTCPTCRERIGFVVPDPDGEL